MNSLLYFAYGSNMSERRLLQRLPGARRVGHARCPSHGVVFHKKGFIDGSGKCGLVAQGQATVEAHGVLFEIAAAEIRVLDEIEGVGSGYCRISLDLYLPDNNVVHGHSYLATHFDEALKPYHWYKHHVVTGAMESGLPADYVDRLVNMESVADPDAARHEKEMVIYD